MPRPSRLAPEPEDLIPLAAETMAGDLRDWVLEIIKTNHKAIPWHLWPEAEQRDLIDRLEAAIRNLIWRCAETIAARGMPFSQGALVKAVRTVKDGLVLQVNVAASDPMRHELSDHVGSVVLLVLADPGDFAGERGKVKIRPDQGDLLDPETMAA